MGVGETGQIIGELGVGEMGVILLHYYITLLDAYWAPCSWRHIFTWCGLIRVAHYVYRQ